MLQSSIDAGTYILFNSHIPVTMRQNGTPCIITRTRFMRQLRKIQKRVLRTTLTRCIEAT